jgi:hypothetical protein
VIKYPTTLFNAIGPVEALSPGKRKSVLLPEGEGKGGKWRGEVEGGERWKSGGVRGEWGGREERDGERRRERERARERWGKR